MIGWQAPQSKAEALARQAAENLETIEGKTAFFRTAVTSISGLAPHLIPVLEGHKDQDLKRIGAQMREKQSQSPAPINSATNA